MRKDLQNKAETADQEIIKIPQKTCQYCDRPLSEFGCRKVSLGDFCLMVGLKQDPRTIIGSAPDPLKPIIEETREVKKAVAEHERATTEAERLDAEWQTAAMAAYSARQQRYTNSRTVLVDGVRASGRRRVLPQRLS